MLFRSLAVVAIGLATFADASPTKGEKGVVIPNNHPLIFFHGRWDSSPGTWWAGSGFKLNVQGLSTLTLNLGNHTTTPNVPVGVSVNYGPFNTVNLTAGSNEIPLGALPKSLLSTTVVRIDSWGWQNNRVNLDSIVLNTAAHLLPYVPQGLTLQFVGDSLSAGQFLPQGVNQAWPFLTGEFFKAEHLINAQPGITLTDMVSYGNEHGMAYQYFRTEDTGYFYTTDHNFTTAWNFKRDSPAPDAIVLHLGTNDSGQSLPAATFVQNYLSYLKNVRAIYPHQPILVFLPWGWPSSDGSISPIYPGSFEEVVAKRKALGDHNTFLVDSTGWVTWDDVFPDNQHPTIAGHQKIAGLFEKWLIKFGIRPQKAWNTPVLGF